MPSTNATINKTVWILDDDVGILEVLEIICKQHGYDIMSFDNVDSFRKRLEFTSPDVLLLDLLLSGEHGVSVCTQLKANPKTANIPVVLMSANINLKDKAKICRADGYVEKPFDISTFIETVERVIKNKRTFHL